MPTSIRDLISTGIDWPPDGHRDRIEAQQTFAMIARNRRHELIQQFSLELLHAIDDEADVVPFPAAKVAARTLAAFLFGEDPAYSHDDDDVQTAVRELAAENLLSSLLFEGAYQQITQGEIYLRPTWDRDLSDRAIVTWIPGSRVIPRFRYGRLVEAAVVTEWVEAKGNAKVGSGSTFRRLVEFYEPGVITRRLFESRQSNRLGGEANLEGFGPTEDLEPEVETEIDDPLLTHVPLGRTEDSPHGVSLFDGLEGMILAMHRLYSQEQHDAEMARRRVAVSEAFVARDSQGRPRLDRRIDLFLLGEEAAGAVGAENKPVHPIQFTDDNIMGERIARRFREFLITCGIAPDSVDANESGGAISGTSRRLAQSLTLQTTGLVGRYWQHAIARVIGACLQIEATHLDADLDPPEDLVTVELADGLIDDMAENAQIIADLDTAEAASTETKVRRANPDWSDEQVADEVARIQNERGTGIPSAPPSGNRFAGNGQPQPEEATA